MGGGGISKFATMEEVRSFVMSWLPRRAVKSAKEGHAHGGGTRRVTMNLRAVVTAAGTWALTLADNQSDYIQWTCRVPQDWVPNTNITLNTSLEQTATAGSPNCVLRSTIGVNKSGDTFSLTNIESAANANQTITQNVIKFISRTITGTSVETGDGIFWQYQRLGSDAGDAIVGGVDVGVAGTWIEYEALGPGGTGVSGATVSDHGTLAGLGDDDHTQYIEGSDVPGGELGGTYASPTVDSVHGPEALAHHTQSHNHSAAGDGIALVPASLDVSAGPLILSGDLTPAAMSATENAYNPAGLSTATVLRLTPAGGGTTINGLEGGTGGRVLILWNTSGADNITLAVAAGSGTNDFFFADDADVVIPPQGSIAIIYDGTLTNWVAANEFLMGHSHASDASGGGSLSPASLFMPLAAAPTPTVEGDMRWDSDDDKIVVGDGAGQKHIVPTASFSGDATVSTAGAVTVAGTHSGSAHHASASASDGKHTVASQVISGVTATATQEGHVELATIAETDTGTDATRAVTPDGLAGSNYGERSIGILVSDPNGDAITVGDGKAYARIPSTMNGWNLIEVGASLSTVSSSGIPTVQVRRSRRASATTRTNADMLSTKLTIDASEFDSEDAAAAAVIDTANDDVNTGDHIYIDIDVAGTGAKGLFVVLTFRLP